MCALLVDRSAVAISALRDGGGVAVGQLIDGCAVVVAFLEYEADVVIARLQHVDLVGKAEGEEALLVEAEVAGTGLVNFGPVA